MSFRRPLSTDRLLSLSDQAKNRPRTFLATEHWAGQKEKKNIGYLCLKKNQTCAHIALNILAFFFFFFCFRGAPFWSLSGASPKVVLALNVYTDSVTAGWKNQPDRKPLHPPPPQSTDYVPGQ